MSASGLITGTARLGVVQSSSQRVHYRKTGRAPYSQVEEKVGWLRCRYFEDHTIGDLIDALKCDQLDGLLFASGALQSRAVRTQV
jgi:hypothetical protein